MRLIKNIIEESLKEYQEGRLNKEFNPIKYYSIIQICIAYLEYTINYQDGLSKERKKHLNRLYYNYQTSKLRKDNKTIDKYKNQIENEMIRDTRHIHIFFNIIETQNIEEELRTELYNQKRIGFLSYELGG
jgi:hypothetical protein